MLLANYFVMFFYQIMYVSITFLVKAHSAVLLIQYELAGLCVGLNLELLLA